MNAFRDLPSSLSLDVYSGQPSDSETVGKSSAPDQASIFASIFSAQGSESSAPAASAADASNALDKKDIDDLLAGNYFDTKPQDSKATCPPDVSIDQLMSADGGLLSHLGNQQLQGDGAKGIKGGILDNLAQLAGGQPGDIGKNKDVTMRALMIVESAKNVRGSDGKMLDDSVRHNGNMSGLTKSNEVIDGSDVAQLQNLFKDPSGFQFPGQRNANAKLHDDGTEKSGAEEFGDHLKDIVVAPFKAIGDGFKGIGTGIKDLFTGHAGDALGDVAKGFTSGVKDIADPIVSAASGLADHLPVIGHALSNNISAVGHGIDHIQDGIASAAHDVGHGQFGNAVSDLANGYKDAGKGIVGAVAHDASDVINQVGLGDTSLGKAASSAGDWLSKQGDKLVGSGINLIANPFKDAGQAATDGLHGNWDAVGHDMKLFGSDGLQLGLAIGAGVATGGVADIGIVGADAVAGEAGSILLSGATRSGAATGQGEGSSLLSSAKKIWDEAQRVRDAADYIHQGGDITQNTNGNNTQGSCPIAVPL